MRNIQILGTLILCLCSLMLVSNQLYSQSTPRTSTLEVVVDESSNAYFTISFEQGETLYSICKEFHIATIDAMMLNEIVNPDQISIGEQLLLPLNKEFFKVKKPSGSGYIPVYYKVKKQETLFRISKVYFAQDVKDMIGRNELSGFTLSIDQNLLVGYYQINGNSPAPLEEIAVAAKPVPPTVVVETRLQETKVVSPTIERPAVTEPSTQAKTTEKSNNNDYVLVDKNVVSQDKVVTYTQEIIIKEEVETPIQQETITQERVVVPTERTVVTSEAASTEERENTTEEVKEVTTNTSKPTLKERLKKVISSDKIDDTISETNNEQNKSDTTVDSTVATEKVAVAAQTEETEITATETIETTVDTIQTQSIIEKPTSNLVSQSKKGIAYWDKKGKDYENLMVLHKSAEVNTLIKLTNPVNGLSTFARVVGKIPENAFKKDIDVVLSPAVARKIGAIDSRMQIAMNYQIIKP